MSGFNMGLISMLSSLGRRLRAPPNATITTMLHMIYEACTMASKGVLSINQPQPSLEFGQLAGNFHEANYSPVHFNEFIESRPTTRRLHVRCTRREHRKFETV